MERTMEILLSRADEVRTSKLVIGSPLLSTIKAFIAMSGCCDRIHH